jgi:DNA-binding response OmpR family regulator
MDTHKIKILIVDDNQQLREMLNLAFDQIPNCQIFNAKNGSEALNIVRVERPNIVFLDVMMPGEIDGYAVCEFVKSSSSFSECFVVILSAKAQTSDKNYGLAMGADKYVTKPFSPLKLLEIIDEWRLQHIPKAFLKKRVLVVDDDPSMIQLLGKMLEQEEHTLIISNDGVEAIRLFREQPIDLVITDIMMPGKDGIELIYEILDEKPDTPIIAVSGNLFLVSSDVNGNPADLLGISCILNKPFTKQELKAAVAKSFANST